MKRRPVGRSFSVPKAGNLEVENEDRFYESVPTRGGGALAYLALSDGATEASFSREWADAMVCSPWWRLIKAPSATDASIVEPGAVEEWLTQVRASFAPVTEDRVLPWYAKAKLNRQGAFGTFLGLRLTQGRGKRKWAAIACGDTCLFHIVDRSIASCFPVTAPTDFNNRPPLVPSSVHASRPVFVRQHDQAWRRGDVFVLATDAAAMWLLDGGPNEDRLALLLNCDDLSTFVGLVGRERAAGRMKNDDTTALIVRT